MSTTTTKQPPPPTRVPKNLNPNPLLAHEPKPTQSQAYTLAHSARCKLSMSAKDPDRNLRFMLGHAFMLDRALYRVATVEEDSDDDDEGGAEEGTKNGNGTGKGEVLAGALDESAEGIEGTGTEGDANGKGDGGEAPGQSGSLRHGRVKFAGSDRGGSDDDGARTPSDDGGYDDWDDYDDDNDGKGNGGAGGGGGALGLTRFTSASAQPPRMIPDVQTNEVDDDEDDDGPVSPPALPADLDVGAVIAGPEDEEMGDLYERIRGCPCHGLHEKAEKGRKFWEVKGDGQVGKKMAIMQVEA